MKWAVCYFNGEPLHKCGGKSAEELNMINNTFKHGRVKEQFYKNFDREIELSSSKNSVMSLWAKLRCLRYIEKIFISQMYGRSREAVDEYFLE